MENVTTVPATSIVIPLYNTEKYIDECLDSLLAQTFQNFEVIVVDDCSTDSSPAIVDGYALKFNGRLTLTYLDENSGSGAMPRNKGLSLSRGEYIFFMDADDVLMKSGLEEMHALAKEYDADVVYCEKYFMYDVLIPALCTALYSEKKSHSDDAKELLECKRKCTARIDVKLAPGEAGGDLQILSVSDDKAVVSKPEWLNKDGVAYLIRSYSGHVKLVAKTEADGQIQLSLKSLNVQNPADKNKSIRYWIYYTSLRINGKAVFNEITPARYGKPYLYDTNVKAGEEITMEINWLSYRSDK